MWTSENRTKYDRDKLRYPGDLTDAEWVPCRFLRSRRALGEVSAILRGKVPFG